MWVKRILDQVEHLAVELGVGAVHLQFDLLAEFAGEVADDARQLLPGIADRLHPRLHDAFLQLGGDVGQPLQRHLELGVLVAPGDLQQLIAGQNQFRHHRHQMFQRVHVDADRLVGDLVGFLDVDVDAGDLPAGFALLPSPPAARGRLPARARRAPALPPAPAPARLRSRSRGRRAPVRRARLRRDAAGAPASGHQRALATPGSSRAAPAARPRQGGAGAASTGASSWLPRSTIS